MKRLPTALLSAALLLVAAPAALAAPTASITGGDTLSVVGDATGETFSVAIDSSATTFSVTANAAIAGSAAGCTGVGTTTVTCPSSSGVFAVSLDAGDGNDTVTVNDASGDFGQMLVTGGPGNDTLNAGTSALTELELGGAGNDTFNGSPQGSDVFAGEPGADTYHGGTATVSAADAQGIDPAVLQRTRAPDEFLRSEAAAVSISLDDVANDGLAGEGDNVGSDVEELYSGDGADTLSAGINSASLNGGGGNDTLNGSPKPDTLSGDDGNDTIRGNDGDDELRDGDSTAAFRSTGSPAPVPGNDHLEGGPGNDLITVDAGADDVSGGPGNDNVYVARYKEQVVNSSAPGFVFAPVIFQPMTVSLDDQPNDGATGAGEGDNLRGDVENVDTADIQTQYRLGFGTGAADDANDVVTGSAASNRIDTGGGNDTIDGGVGADVLNAGTGDDAIQAVDQFTDVIDCNAGNDSVTADLPGANASRADVLNDCEAITGTPLGPTTVNVPVPTPVPTTPAKPTVVLSGAKTVKSATFLKSFSLSVGVSSDQAYAATAEATTTGAKIAKVGDLSIGSGKLSSGTGKRTLKVSITKKYRASLKRKLRTSKQKKKGIKLSVQITVTNAAGQVVRASRTFSVKG